MDLEFLREALDSIPIFVLVLMAFLAGAIEATPVLGLIVPANSIAFLVALHWARIERWPVDLVAAYAVGSLLGDIVFFFVGRAWGLAFMEKWPGVLRVSAQRREALEKVMHAHGGKAVFIARFQPGIRSFSPYVAGAARLSASRFLSASALAGLGMGAVVVLGGYLTGLGLEAAGKALGWTVTGLALGVLVAVLAIVWVRSRRKKQPVEVAELAK